MIRGSLAAAAAALMLALAGCGGSSPNYRADTTKGCLAGTSPVKSISHSDADYIALAAVNGGYLVYVGQTEVDVSFYRNHSDATEKLRAYELFGVKPGPTLYVKRNAVLAWDDTPTSTEKSAVDGCLTA